MRGNYVATYTNPSEYKKCMTKKYNVGKIFGYTRLLSRFIN